MKTSTKLVALAFAFSTSHCFSLSDRPRQDADVAVDVADEKILDGTEALDSPDAHPDRVEVDQFERDADGSMDSSVDASEQLDADVRMAADTADADTSFINDISQSDIQPVDVRSNVDILDVQPALDSPNPSDSPNPAQDTGVCPVGTTACAMNGCVDTQRDARHCGRCANICPSTANGAAVCSVGACAISCDAGFMLVGGVCLSNSAFPRQIAPISLSDVTLRRPTLRWVLPMGFDGAAVELCRDRACTDVIESARVLGTSMRPAIALAARTTVFWRIRGTSGAVTSPVYSPTWLFHVPTNDATSGVDTSAHPHTDFNGDGYDDLVIGAHWASPGGAMMAGTATIYHGSMNGITAVPVRTLTGSAANEWLGTAVAGAGDLNGDGYGDLIVSALIATRGALVENGEVSVFLGSASGIGASGVSTTMGSQSRGNYGQSLAGVGDVNGDGYADVLIGADRTGPGGEAYLHFGIASGLNTTPARIYSGAAANDRKGSAVAGLGDVNGDGLSDFAIGIPYSDNAALADAGAAEIYYGIALGPQLPVTTIRGTGAIDVLGYSLSSAGDVNNDGYSDVAIGAVLGDRMGMTDNGYAWIFHGSIAGLPVAPSRELIGVRTADNFGRSVALGGDLNGDGYGDIIVGANMADPSNRQDVGAASIFLGSMNGVPTSATTVLEGVARGDHFGFWVSGGSDFDRDGIMDVAVGAYGVDVNPNSEVGAVSIFRGGVVIGPAPTILLRGIEASSEFGKAIALFRQQFFWLRRGRPFVAAPAPT